MPLADPGGGGGGGNTSKPRIPRAIRRPSSPISALLNGAKPSHPSPVYSTYTPPKQTVFKSRLVRKDPGPYSISDAAWGASAFPKQSAKLAEILPRLRSRLADEPAFNSILSQLMTDRYDIFQDRLDRKFDNQKTQYQIELKRNLAAQDQGLPYEIPEMPKMPGLGRGQGMANLLETYTESVKPGMSDEVKDAYSQFYKYELERVLDFKQDLRGQRSSLRTARDEALVDFEGSEARGEGESPTASGSPFGGILNPVINQVAKGKNKKESAVGPFAGLFDPTQYKTKEEDDDDSGGGGILGGLLGAAATPFDKVMDAKDAAFDAVWDEAKDPLFWAIDKLSRPLYGTMNTASAYYGMDDDEYRGGESVGDQLKDFWFKGGLAGRPIWSGLDEIKDDPTGAGKEFGSAFWEGFSGKDKKMFSQVIAENAERDPSHNVWDNQNFQGAAGFYGDVAGDPINFVGMGVVTKPVAAVKGVKNFRELMDTSRAANKLLSKADEQVYSGVYDPVTKQHIPAEGPKEKVWTPKEIYSFMSGDGSSTVASSARKSQNLAETNYRLQRLMYRLDNASFNVDESELNVMNQIGAALRSQREQVLKDFHGATVVDSLRRDLKIKIANGDEPASAMDEFDGLITSTYLEKKLIDANIYQKYLDDMAELPKHKGGFGAAASYKYADDNVTRTRSVSNVTVEDEAGISSGNRQNVNVAVGGTKSRKGSRKAHAWENVEKSYENAKSLHAKETDPKIKAQRKQELDAFRAKIDKILNEAPEGTGPLSEIAPELVKDYRLTPEKVDQLFTDAYKAAWDNPRFTRLSRESEAINEQRKYGHNATVRASAATRWSVINRQKNRILGDVATKILKTYFDGEEAYKDIARVREIRSEISRLDKEHGTPKVGTKDSPILDRWGDDTDRAYRQQLHEELQSLKGYADSGTPRSLTDVPEQFKSEGAFDLAKLKNALYVDSRTGKVEGQPNAFFGTFKNRRSVENMDAATQRWVTDMRHVLQERYEPLFDEAYAPVKAAKKKLYDEGSTADKALNTNFGKYTREAALKAEREAFDSIGRDMAFGRLNTIDYYDEVPVKHLSTESPEQDLLDALKFNFSNKEAELKLQKYVAQRGKQDEEVAMLNDQLAGLRTKWNKEFARQTQIVAEAKEAQKIMSKRLREEALLTAAQLGIRGTQSKLSLKLIGKDLVIPHSDVLFKGVEKMSGFPLFKQAREVYAASFKPPSSFLPEDMRLASARALGQTPIIIEHHVNALRKTLGQVPEHRRVDAWDSILKGHGNIRGEQPVQDAINDAFEDLLPFFQGYDMGFGVRRLSVEDINKYLPEEFRVSTSYARKNPIDTVQHLVNAIRANKKNISQGTKRSDRNQLKDPYRVAWAMRVGVEQAQGRRALEHTVNSIFGVKDLRTTSGAKDVGELNAEFKKLGWNTIEKLGGTHLFPPEVIPDIHRLLDMLEPRNITNVGRLMDRTTGYWKTMTTIYNPGYWTRNGIGEVMSSWLGGVTDPRWYERSFNGVIKYARGDGKELDALKKQFSAMHHVQSESVPGSRKVSQLKDGTPITAEQVWVHYNDQGLKTGFVNTEFDAQYSRLGDTMRSTKGTQSAANFHSGLRGAGEWYEDGLRIAHFMYAMEKSGAKTIEAAASYAAKEVRKYHFDYTDFTNFEKTVMLRAFPFYKWTRKSLPLMTTMLFTKPGKMLAYPKAMSGLQNTITTQDIANDDNGFAPNYGELVPGWIQDMWAYQIAGHETEGDEASYLNLNTPQMSSLQTYGNPLGTGYGLLNPLIKFPAEAGQIISGNGDSESFLKSFSNITDFTDSEPMDIGLQSEDQNKTDAFWTQFLRSTPQGNFATKFGGLDGKEDSDPPTDNELITFLTGLGLHLNDDDRRSGVLMDRKGL